MKPIPQCINQKHTAFVFAAIKVFPTNLKAYYRQAVALKHQKRYTEAVQAAQRGQEIQPISVCLFSRGEGIGRGAVQAAQRGQEIQPISVCLFSRGGGGLRQSKLPREDKKYNLYLYVCSVGGRG